MTHTIVGRCYGLLLRLLPRDFHERYAEEMREFFEDSWADSGHVGRIALSLRALSDVAWTAVVVRVSPSRYGTLPRVEAVSGIGTDAMAALRGLRRRPAFTMTAVVTAALGIASTVAVYSVVDATVLHGVGVPQERQVMSLWGTFEKSPGREFSLSLAEYSDIRTEVRALARVGAWSPSSLLLEPMGEEPARRVDVARTYGDIYALVGAHTAIGRLPGESDDQLGAPLVAVISHQLWTTTFAADSAIIGTRTLPTGARTALIIGVLAPNATLPGQTADIWLHSVPDPATWARDRSGHGLNSLGLLRTGATEAGVRSELAVLQATWAIRYAGQHSLGIDGHDVHLMPIGDRMLGASRRVAVLLSVASGVLLLLACANVASLLLARGETRTAEVGVRLALGASSRRVAQPVVLEGLAVAGAGGLLGLLLVGVGLPMLLRLAPASMIGRAPSGINAGVAVFALAISLVTGALFALEPARRAARQTPVSLFGSSGRGRSASMRGLKWLVGGQTMLAALLLVAAALLTRSLQRLNAIDPGLDVRSRVALDISIPTARYAEASRVVGFYETVLPRIAELRGVESASFVRVLPLRDPQRIENVIREGEVRNDGYLPVSVQTASSGVLHTLGIPVLQGRDLEASDRAGAVRVTLINSAAATALWPGEDPIGKRFRGTFLPESIGFMTVVGVYGDVRSSGLATTPSPEIILPIAQGSAWTGWLQNATLVVHASGPVTEMVSALRTALEDFDPYVSTQRPMTMHDVLATNTAHQRFIAVLLTTFALIALVIAGVGVFGVVSFTVARQRRELAIRTALGAGRMDVVRGVLRASAGVASVGAVVGSAIAALTAPALSGFLYGTPARDVVVFVGVPVTLITVALTACIAPAVRAMRIPAVQALQEVE